MLTWGLHRGFQSKVLLSSLGVLSRGFVTRGYMEFQAKYKVKEVFPSKIAFSSDTK